MYQFVCAVSIVCVLSTASFSADQADIPPIHPPASVGVGTKVLQLVIPGPELEAKQIEDQKSPVVVRILATYRHGNDHRYDLEYYGLEPGRFDLRDYLQRKDHEPLESVPELMVEIKSQLPPGHVTPSATHASQIPRVGGYRFWICCLWTVWLVLAVWLLIGKRQRYIQTAAQQAPLSLVERLRPLVVDAINHSLTAAQQAELERLLLGYWRQRLGLDDADPVTALAEIRRDPEAGKLLRHIEDWLHRPGGAGQVDIAAILAPYQDLPDEVPTNPTPERTQFDSAMTVGERV